MIPTIGYIIGAYAIARLFDTAWSDPEDKGPSLPVRAVSALAILFIAFMLYQIFQQSGVPPKVLVGN